MQDHWPLFAFGILAAIAGALCFGLTPGIYDQPCTKGAAMTLAFGAALQATGWVYMGLFYLACRLPPLPKP